MTRTLGTSTLSVSGYYVLSMGMKAYSHSSYYATVRMVHNGQSILYVADRTYGGDSVSNQIIKYLRAGDNVWTELEPNGYLHSGGQYFATFSGFYISA